MLESITAIVKPTHECNLACKYCYIDQNAESGRMNPATLEKTLSGLASLSGIKRVHLIWHGGEPLIMGPEFYLQAVEIERRFPSIRFENGMQSNLTLLDDSFLDFFEQFGFNVGSSMDGPEEIHNLTRVYPDGRGSFRDVWKGVTLLRQRNAELRRNAERGRKPKHLGEGVITVLHRKNIGRVREIYEFFKEHEMNIKLNPLIRSGRAEDNYEDLGIGPREYGNALVTLFDQWFNEPEEGIDINPLTEIMGNLMTRVPVGCNFGTSCRDHFVSVGPEGDIYPCGRFDGVKDYWMGNVHTTGFSTAFDSEVHKRLANRKRETVSGCKTCDYGDICNAGCMHNAYMRRGKIEDRDFYCASYKTLFAHLNEAVQKELRGAIVTSEGIVSPGEDIKDG